MKTQSSKKAKVARWLASLERPECCESCGRYGHTEPSHTVTRAQEESLEMDRANIVFECRACHMIWEHKGFTERKELLTYERKRAYMKEKAPRVYELQVTRGRMD